MGANPTGLLLVPPNTLVVACYGARPGVVEFLDRHSGRVAQKVVVAANPTQLAREPVRGLIYVAAAGANVFVSGSGIFGKPDYAAIIAEMREHATRL